MRVIYKIVLGLFLFNAILTLFGPIFATSLSDSAISVDEMESYKLDSPTDIISIIFSWDNLGAWGASVIILAGGVLVALATKNYVYIGVTLFVSIVIGVYIKMSTVIATIGGQTDNVYVTGIIAIVGIAIGLIVVFNVVDMFAPAPAR